mmetsp:Transcript_92235/g.145830  ORF Transcript_92235/g.145830 Transcript_92235/m.145830 type:complete len:221 (+) Transcript_92235:1-663(+)
MRQLLDRRLGAHSAKPTNHPLENRSQEVRACYQSQHELCDPTPRRVYYFLCWLSAPNSGSTYMCRSPHRTSVETLGRWRRHRTRSHGQDDWSSIPRRSSIVHQWILPKVTHAKRLSAVHGALARACRPEAMPGLNSSSPQRLEAGRLHHQTASQVSNPAMPWQLRVVAMLLLLLVQREPQARDYEVELNLREPWAWAQVFPLLQAATRLRLLVSDSRQRC